jgi:diadenosine tetraphosphatase ApaH/serine/threonine PP2A family protein phosphatase
MAFTILLASVTIVARSRSRTFCTLSGVGWGNPLNMRLLLISDIHANLEALETCLSVAPAHDRVVNLGDVVGYNASPNEVCERVIAMGAPVVRGNHDRACSGMTDVKDFNPVAAISAYWTRNSLKPEHLEWLRALPQGPLRSHDFPGMEFVHGSPSDEDEYLLNTSSADDNLELPEHAPLIFFGHTHIQGGFIDEQGESRPFRPIYDSLEGAVQYTLWLTPGERYLINPGSVGQPRDNDWRSAFALYEHNGGPLASVTFYRVPYDIEQTQQRILSAQLPERLAARLKIGR